MVQAMREHIPFEKILKEALREGGEFADLFLNRRIPL